MENLLKNLVYSAVVVSLVLISGCGNKGPLYIPDTETEQQSQDQNNSE